MKYAVSETMVSIETVQRYMPSNYDAVRVGEITLIFGEDSAGWTLEDYVIPRLGSGLIIAKPIEKFLADYVHLHENRVQ